MEINNKEYLLINGIINQRIKQDLENIEDLKEFQRKFAAEYRQQRFNEGARNAYNGLKALVKRIAREQKELR